jgi:membrane associated rhomboid family serine protease
MNLQVWRIITGTFVHTDLLNLLFSVISYIPSAIYEENQIGTVPFAVKFWKLSIFINFIYSLFSIILGMLAFPSVMEMPTMGLWPILMCDLVIQCM